MTHYYRDYAAPEKTREQHDEQAIADTYEFLGPEIGARLDHLLSDKTLSVQDLNVGLAFAGVSGRPFFALMRRHRLAEFREWCLQPANGGSVETDEQGFIIWDEETTE